MLAVGCRVVVGGIGSRPPSPQRHLGGVLCWCAPNQGILLVIAKHTGGPGGPACMLQDKGRSSATAKWWRRGRR